MSRKDGRSANELRPLAISHSVLTRADGSAKFSFGTQSVMASVTGPSEVRIRDELVDRATLELNVLPLRGLTNPSTKAQETTLRALLAPLILLHLYPRSLLQLTLQTLSSPTTAFSQPISTDPSSSSTASTATTTLGALKPPGASLLAAHINAAMLGLLDAAVELKGLVLAVAVAFISNDDGQNKEEMLVLDPTPEEEERAGSVHVFAFSFGSGVGGEKGECVGVESIGTFTENQLFEAQDLARDATVGLRAFVRKSIELKYGVKNAPPPPPPIEASESGGMDVEE